MDIALKQRLNMGGGRPCIIVPLTSSSLQRLVEEASALASLPVDVAEWRVDMFCSSSGVDEKAVTTALASLKKVISVPLLATFRTMDEGGCCPAGDGEYESLCDVLCESGLVDLLDVEAFFRSGRAKDIIARAHAAGVGVVASNHDFQATPPKAEMVRRLLYMQDELDADILKIAVMPHSRADVLALLSATEEASRRAKRPVVTMSMGPLGVISRVCGQFFGSAATFGAAEKASAPGQMDVGSLDMVLRALDEACGENAPKTDALVE
ncbi:type I 3-dehydroquinate dehydratase [uncultured Mailhella sp.]|uniref:type I 3-dehydroquinate dehydratase n=1 Tax=uncultured Mailhella sp. TaxID=1981031 RepID=UPI0025CDD437|nr:type I 3-dehydroquinate dehydratase [uncultured Mailhella sp.]